MMGNFSKAGSSNQFNMPSDMLTQPPPAPGKMYQGYGAYNQTGQSFDGGNSSFGQSSSRNNRWGNEQGEEQRWGNHGNWGNNRGDGGPLRGGGGWKNNNRGIGRYYQRS